jgi:anti-sigma B factor antagonist
MTSTKVTFRPEATSAGRDVLRLSVRRQGALVRIDVHGELDLATSADLTALINQVTDEPGQTLVVDLRALTFCDCAGLRVLVHQHHRLHERGGALILLRPPPRIQQLLTLIGLDHQLHIRPNLAGRPGSRPKR